jgi:hypothetical protein
MNYYLNAFNEMLRKRQENQMGRGGDGRSANPQFDAMSNAQKADYYSNNPTMAGITQGLQKGFGMTSYGMLQNALAPDFVREQQAIAQGFPNVEAYSGSRNFGKESSLPAGGVVSPGMPQPKGFFESLFGSSVQLDPAPFETRTATPNPYAGENPALSSTGSGFAGADIGSGGGFTGGVATGDSGGSPADAANLGYNQGGMVTPERLMGRAPAPDDGYGALQGGEYVITKAAVERYGKAMMDAINNGTFR